jgi:MFS family permease
MLVLYWGRAWVCFLRNWTEDRDASEAARQDEVLREETEIARSYAQKSSPAERRRAFLILFVSLVCMGAGQSVIYTILPPIARQLDIGPLQVTSIFAVSAAIWIFSSAFWGYRSDRAGRKPVMLLGLVAFAVSFIAFATAMLAGLQHWVPVGLVFPLLIAARCIYGTFGSGTSAAAQAYVADRTTPEERLRGVTIVSMAFALGTTVGPVIGAVFALIGLLAPFYFISLLAFASALAVFLLLPERRAPPMQRRREPAKLRWYEPRMLPFVGFGLVLSMVASIPIQTAGFFFMDVLKRTPYATAQFTSIGLTLSAIAALFGQFVIVQRSGLSSRTLTAAGLIIAAASNGLFLIPVHLSVILLALLLSGLGFGLARPGFTTGASLSVAPHEQGAVAGLLNAAGAAGFIFGPLLGWLYEFSPYIPYVFGAAMMLMLLAAQYLSPVLRHAGDLPAAEAQSVPLAGG